MTMADLRRSGRRAHRAARARPARRARRDDPRQLAHARHARHRLATTSCSRTSSCRTPPSACAGRPGAGRQVFFVIYGNRLPADLLRLRRRGRGRARPGGARGGPPAPGRRAVQALVGEMDTELAAARLAVRHMIDVADSRSPGPGDDQRDDDRTHAGGPRGHPHGREGAGGRRGRRLLSRARPRAALPRRPGGALPPAAGEAAGALHADASRSASTSTADPSIETSERRTRCSLPGSLTIGVFGIAAAVALAVPSRAEADVVTDANAKAAEIASRHPATPIAVRMMAIVQVSVFEAVNAITGRYPAFRAKLSAAPGALRRRRGRRRTRGPRCSKLMPGPAGGDRRGLSGRPEAASPTGPAKTSGIAVGEQAAAAIVALCADDGGNAADTYRPHAAPGVYVADDAARRAALGQAAALGHDAAATSSARARRPRLTSDTWTRDYTEIKAIGGKDSTLADAGADGDREVLGGDGAGGLLAGRAVRRDVPGRDVTDNARLLAVAAMAMDDALDRRVRRQVHLQLLAAGHRDPQRTRRQRRRRRARSAGRRSSTRRCTPSTRARTASCPRRWAPCSQAEIGTGPAPQLSSSSSPRRRRRAHVGDRRRASCRRWRWRASTTACTTGTRRTSGRRWASKIGELAAASVPKPIR